MHTGEAIVPPGATGKHIADVIDRDRAANSFRGGLEPIANLLVFIGKRQATYATLCGSAEFCGLHEGVPQTLGIDLQVLHFVSRFPLAAWADLTSEAGGWLC